MKKPNTSLVKKSLLIAALPLSLMAGSAQAHFDSDILIPVLLWNQYQLNEHNHSHSGHHSHSRHVRHHYPRPRHVHNYHYQPRIKHHPHHDNSHGHSHHRPKRLQKENARFR